MKELEQQQHQQVSTLIILFNSQNQLRCPTCQTLLNIPQGTELFRCPCGQTLRNPYYQLPPAEQKKSATSKSKNKDLVDAGIGLG